MTLRLSRLAFLLAILAVPFAVAASDADINGIANDDRAFAEQVLVVAVAGRPVGHVIEELRSMGFTCLEHDNRVLSGSGHSVTFQRHICGASVPALHGCARNVELGSFDGLLKHIRVSLLHPGGSPDAGAACGR